ncbi:hypothetical protein ACLOJK_018119 [Asimina triloba]
MAIAKHSIKDSRSKGEFSPATGDSLLSDDESELRTPSSFSSDDCEDDDDDAFDLNDGGDEGVDSGAESDDFDLSELGEIGAEFCLVGNWNCSVPYELYDLPDLKGILSLDTWNNCLSDEERFRLAEFLPDMDLETYQHTLKELFEGCNFHFGSPLADLFDRLKGGLCEPRVALYRQGLNFFERRSHYHLLRKYQNSMVRSLFQMRDAWVKTGNCGIEEKLRILEAEKSRRVLMMDEKENESGSETDSSVREGADERFRVKKAKTNHRALYTVRPSDGMSKEMVMALEPSKFEKFNRKGIVEVAPPKVYSKKDRLDAAVNGIGMKFSPSVAELKSSRMDSRGIMGKDRPVTQRKKDAFSKKYGADARVGLGKEENESLSWYGSLLRKEDLRSHGKKKNATLMMEVETLTGKVDHYSYPSMDSRERIKSIDKPWGSLGEDGTKSMKHKDQQFFSKKSHAYWLAGDGQPQNRKTPQDDLFSADHTLKFEPNIRRKKQKIGGEFQAARKHLFKSWQVDWTRGKSPEIDRRSHGGNSLVNEEDRKGISMSDYVEETESDSSEEVGGEVDINPSGYVSSTFGSSQTASVRPPADPQQARRRMWRDKREYGQQVTGATPTSRKTVDLGEHVHIPRTEISTSKRSQTGNNFFLDNSNTHLERRRNTKSLQNGQVHDGNGGMSDPLSVNAYSSEKKQKGKVNPNNSFPLSDYIGKYAHEVLDGDNLPDVSNPARIHKSWKKDVKAYITEASGVERSGVPLLGCSSTIQRQKGKADAMHLDGSDKHGHFLSVSQKPIEDPASMKKHGKKKLDAESAPLTVVTPDSIASEREMVDRDMDTKLPKKPFTLITPSVHTGFSFSIIHLLSAVRRAMTTSHGDDNAEVEKLVKKEKVMFPDDENMDVNDSDYMVRKNLHSLTVQEIVSRVRSNPGDPCILETQEPLQDLIRGVLKIFSSKTAPLGAKAWKPLVFYEKSAKSWSWIGPVTSSALDGEAVVEETSSYAWGVPHKMLVKLVDAFANWLKSGQETLKQIGSLPPPPPMFQILDEKERFRDLRAQKSLATIGPSSDEMREYFRKEEVLRYSIPDRAFSYTATDGGKSIVAPLRRSGGKAREHFILKPDRPPHVTILCLVRDAAARLPGSIGTRADVCTLIRDSQYIVENISDAQLNQIVSGALDRLHYERDPCVQFDAERKLWVYLHRDREEEDFEDDGTSSTKKWKRPRKGSVGNPAPEALNDVGPQGTGDQVAGGSAVASDLNSDSMSVAAHKRELADHDLHANLEENIGQFIDGAQNSIGHPMGWEVLDLNAIRENKVLCLKNSKNEDFDDEHSEGKDQLGMIVQSSMQRMDVT